MEPQTSQPSKLPSAIKPEFQPQPHQVRATTKLVDNNGKLVMTAPPGTGKTYTAIYGFETLVDQGKAKRALVLVPSGLRTNFAKDGVEKFTSSNYQVIGGSGEAGVVPGVLTANNITPDKKYTIVSYEMFMRDPIGIVRRSGADTMICDEYHKTRNENTRLFKTLAAVRPAFNNFIGLTASPVNNDVSELASLLSLSEGRRIATPKQFKQTFVRPTGYTQGFSGAKVKDTRLDNLGLLLASAYPKLDYISYDQVRGDKIMPRKQLSNVQVPMSKEQWDLYNLALDRLGPDKESVLRGNPNISLKDAGLMFARMAQARQVANSVGSAVKGMDPARSYELTPKAKRVVDDTVAHLKEDPSHSVVLYSNLVNGGVDVLLAGLRKQGIEPAVFIGKGAEVGGGRVTSAERELGVQEYKAGKKKVIVLSGAGAEGLDLRNSTAFFSLDGHFNPERILQPEARARRLGGQDFRPPEKRVVDVRRYMSVAPPGATMPAPAPTVTPKPGIAGFFGAKNVVQKPAYPPFTIDQWAYRVAGKKYQKTEQLYAALKEPYKYIRKYQVADGSWRYVYPDADGSPIISKTPPVEKTAGLLEWARRNIVAKVGKLGKAEGTRRDFMQATGKELGARAASQITMAAPMHAAALGLNNAAALSKKEMTRRAALKSMARSAALVPTAPGNLTATPLVNNIVPAAATVAGISEGVSPLAASLTPSLRIAKHLEQPVTRRSIFDLLRDAAAATTATPHNMRTAIDAARSLS